jgi:hypothetical protein
VRKGRINARRPEKNERVKNSGLFVEIDAAQGSLFQADRKWTAATGKDPEMRNRLASLMAAVIASSMTGTMAMAAPFTLLIFENREELARRTDTGEKGATYWGSYAQFAEAAGKAGILRGGAALHTNDLVRSLTMQGGAMQEGEGFDADAPLRLSGYFQIDVADAPAAMVWASKIPAAATGRIEIRAGYPAPSMN